MGLVYATLHSVLCSVSESPMGVAVCPVVPYKGFLVVGLTVENSPAAQTDHSASLMVFKLLPVGVD